MSHGRTDLGAHMSTPMILSVTYTVAASLEASYKGRYQLVVQVNRFQGFHLLHNGVIARGDIVFDSVLRLQLSLEFGVDAVVRFVVGEQPTIRPTLDCQNWRQLGRHPYSQIFWFFDFHTQLR